MLKLTKEDQLFLQHLNNKIRLDEINQYIQEISSTFDDLTMDDIWKD